MPWPQYKVDGMARVAVGRRGRRWTATICRACPPPLVAVAAATTAGEGGQWMLTGKGRAAVDGDDLPGASAAVGGGGDRGDGRQGRTLMGKGHHVHNTEVDGMARTRAAAGWRGLRSLPVRAKIVAVCLHRWWQRRQRRQVRVNSDWQGTRAGVTKTAGEGGL